jgi:putative flavoprotein involved in K+ transport
VIWTSGFRGNFNYLKLPVFDDIGNLIHNEGSSEIEGLYFLGLPWMRKRKSGIILGIAEDAEFIANKIIIK